MGLSKSSIGLGALDEGRVLHKKREGDIVAALAGNPNVGKSTVFNQMTGLRQHTGNWAGKTVANAQGYASYEGQGYVLVDIPGCYSLDAHSAEEGVARDFICSGEYDVAVVVCDALCLERNMGLVLQILQKTEKVVVCVNLMDEAEKKQICIDLKKLEERLGVPVVGTAARDGTGLEELYLAMKERAKAGEGAWHGCVGCGYRSDAAADAQRGADKCICKYGCRHGGEWTAEEICRGIVEYKDKEYAAADRRKDKFFTGKITGIPVMVLLLFFIFWLTIVGANYPSELLHDFFLSLEDKLIYGLSRLGMPVWIREMLVYGMFRVVAWVVSVMLPPMAIFFPLFTVLEDSGYLPRVAFNLDKCFKKCRACGKQALTMAMGFGCNAAGVVGCRIIDSPRERLIAIITNSFVPCNGRFPTLIAVITMFFAGMGAGASLGAALLLTGVILLGIGLTFFASWFLSATFLKGVPSSFALEMPPYRRPQIGKVVIRSVFDRTMFVLGRALLSAAPAGILLWVLANFEIEGMTMLSRLAGFLDRPARLMGMDGVILLAFILGLPANEIVVPIMLMAYLAEGSLVEVSDLHALKQLLVNQGWTWATAVSVMLFTLVHWPCATTCLTIRKATGSMKWTVISFLVPCVSGCLLCMLFHGLVSLVIKL